MENIGLSWQELVRPTRPMARVALLFGYWLCLGGVVVKLFVGVYSTLSVLRFGEFGFALLMLAATLLWCLGGLIAARLAYEVIKAVFDIRDRLDAKSEAEQPGV